MSAGSVHIAESRLVTYDLGADERVLDGLTEVFDAIGYDLYAKEPPLIDYVDPEAVDMLRAKDPDFSLATSIWQHPVRITTDEITVHEARDE